MYRIEEVNQDKVFAWYIHPMYTMDGKFNRGMYEDVQLFKPPVIKKMPADFS